MVGDIQDMVVIRGKVREAEVRKGRQFKKDAIRRGAALEGVHVLTNDR